MIRLKATMTTISLKNVTKIYKNEIWKLHKVPQKIIGDRGSQFTSKFIKDLTMTLETKKHCLLHTTLRQIVK